MGMKKGDDMKFVHCTLLDADGGVVDFTLNLSRVDRMWREGSITYIHIGGTALKVKETPVELFRREDIMTLCISRSGTEFHQVIAEGRKRIEEQLAEEESRGRQELVKEESHRRKRMEMELEKWAQRERKKISDALAKVFGDPPEVKRKEKSVEDEGAAKAE